MSTSDESTATTTGGLADAAMDTQFRALAERVAKTADSDLKEFLAGILKATETTLVDLKAMRERLDNAQAKADAAAAAAQIARKNAGETALRADIRAEAQAAGAVDAGDVLPFISLSDVKLSEDGKVNIVELVSALKKSKPHLFTKVSTSATHLAPKPGNVAPKNALEMTTGEYRAAKARFTKR
jgi:hypothetical protein